VGSGYVKDDPVSSEFGKKVQERLAERAKQDALLFSPLPLTTTATSSNKTLILPTIVPAPAPVPVPVPK